MATYDNMTKIKPINASQNRKGFIVLISGISSIFTAKNVKMVKINMPGKEAPNSAAI